MKQKDLVESFPDMRRNFGETFSDNTRGVTIEIWWKMTNLKRKMAKLVEKNIEVATKKWPTLVKKIAGLQKKMANSGGKSSGVSAKNGQLWWKK